MSNYVKSILRPNSNIFLVGEVPDAEADRIGKPFPSNSKAGRLLDQLLEQAGINRAEVSLANVAREKPPGNKVSFFFEDRKCTQPKPIMQQWINELRQEIIDTKPNMVVALGATAMYALMEEKGMMENRGYIQQATLVPGQKMLVTWSPQKVSYEWKLAFETVMDLRKAKNYSLSPDIQQDKRILNAYPSTSEFIEFLTYLVYEHKHPVSVDIETTANAHIDILGLADSPVHGMSYNLFNSGRTPRLPPEDEVKLWTLFAKVMQKREIIMQNGMYDVAVLMYHNNIFASGYKYDTMVAAHACWPEAKRSLAFLSSICINVPKWKHKSMDAPGLYNASDCANTYAVWNVLEAEMEKLGVRHTFDFEMLQTWPSMMLQLQGIEVNKDRQVELIKSITQRVTELDVEIKNDIGKKINLNSYKQLQTLLYIDMKLPIQYKRRKSRYDDRKMTSDAEALNKLSRISNNPVLEKILQYKKMNKLLQFVDIEVSPAGRVHTSYNVTGATMARQKKGLVVDDEDSYKSFGRWSSSKSIIVPYGSGNLQNIPGMARMIYTAPKGYVLLQADYIQAEGVVVAYEIRDEYLIDMFKKSFGMSREERKANHYDIHVLTAKQMFGLDFDQITPEIRTKGKVIRHATNYSAGPGVVAKGLGCTMAEGKILLTQFHNGCPQLRLWHKEIQKELYRTRTLVNLLGRKHRFTDRWGDNLFRSAYAYKPQSTVGDLLNTALVRFYNRYGSEIALYLQLHDAIYVLSRAKDSEVVKNMDRMRECMLMPLRSHGEEFMIDVDFAMGPSWGEMEEI